MFIPGRLLDGRYEIVSLLGEGGMGEVYRARRRLLGDEVAIKVMQGGRQSQVAGDALRERFLRESRACAQLRHPHIVSILDFDLDEEGRPYLVMELLNGPSLRQELSVRGSLDLAATTHIVNSLAAALQLAHDRGVVHRDLKPANLVSHRFDSGEKIYKVIDFGLANIRDTTSAADETRTRLTTAREFLGTVAYASPEQLRGEPTDSAQRHLLARRRRVRDADRGAALRCARSDRGGDAAHPEGSAVGAHHASRRAEPR